MPRITTRNGRVNMQATYREGAKLLYERFGTAGSVFTVQELVEVADIDPEDRGGVIWWFRVTCRANGLVVTRARLNLQTLNMEYQVTTDAAVIHPHLMARVNGVVTQLDVAAFEAGISKTTATTQQEHVLADYAIDLNDFAKERGDVMRKLEETLAAEAVAAQEERTNGSPAA